MRPSTTATRVRLVLTCIAILVLVLPMIAASGSGPADSAPDSGSVASAAGTASLAPRPEPAVRPYRLFPSLYRTDSPLLQPQVLPAAYDVPGVEVVEGVPETELRIPMIVSTDIVAFYGKPGAVRMGILGEYRKEELTRLLDGYVRLYDEANGERKAKGAFYIIYGTCWPGGEIGILNEKITEEWIAYAAANDMLVFLDHQIGKYTVEEATRRLLPWLRYPNVHLALDPEWRTHKPMEEIGSITAEELNDAQRMVDEYLAQKDLPGLRMLVVHQFNRKMIASRERVRADFDRVLLVHNADGFGPPALKRSSYAMNAEATNMPLKGFKLFFKSKYPGAGYDEPLLTPAQVLGLNPRPVLVMYQ